MASFDFEPSCCKYVKNVLIDVKTPQEIEEGWRNRDNGKECMKYDHENIGYCIVAKNRLDLADFFPLEYFQVSHLKYPVLFQAAVNLNFEMFFLLVEKGEDITKTYGLGKRTVLMSVVMRDEFKDKLEMCRSIITATNGDKLINMKDLAGNTALHMSVYYRNIDIMNLLLENGADIDAVNSEGCTPFMMAISSPGIPIEISELLFEVGANIHIMPGRQYISVINQIYLNHEKRGHNLIEKILNRGGVNLNYQESRQRPILIQAVKKNDLHLIKMLLEFGADINIQTNQHGDTALHYSICMDNHEEIAIYLIQKGADLFIENRSGYDSLMTAVNSGSIEIINLMFESGIRIDVRGKYGQEVMHEAFKRGNVQIIEYLTLKYLENLKK